jgi:hypothetical protein
MTKTKNFLSEKAQKACKRGTAAMLCVILVLLLAAGSCEKPPEDDQSIIGSWKLIELKYPPYTDYGNQTIVDYSDSAIIFTFKENNSLLITGNMQGGYLPEGEYTYTYKIIKGTPTSVPGLNLYINNRPCFANISEQVTKLEIFNDEWSIDLIKLNSK